MKSISIEESDDDILTVTEVIDIENTANERGKLLRQSTLKPAVVTPKPVQEPDPIPANCTDTTKRITRIVRQPNQPPILSVTVVPKTKSIGVQVGSPSRELTKQNVVAPVVLSAPEPPLKSYWTHRINLPYPPAQSHGQQPVISGQYMQQPQQYQYYQQQYAPPLPFTQPQFIQTGPFNQPQPSRRQKRNFTKHQKYLQRKFH